MLCGICLIFIGIKIFTSSSIKHFDPMRHLLRKSGKANKWLLLSAVPYILVSLFMAGKAFSLHAQTVNQLSSPDGHISMQLSTRQNELHYSVQFKSQQLAEGNIGFASGDNADVVYGQQVKSVTLINAQKKQQRRLTTRGNHNTATIIKNQYNFKITSKDGKTDFWLAVNLYDNGVAYRYSVLPEGRPLTREMSHISFPGTTTLWWQEDIHTYEGNYRSALFSQLGDSLQLGMPLTLQYKNGLYGALMEANIFGFAGSHFSHYKNDRTLEYTLAGPVQPGNQDTLHSGWQIMAISNTLNGLVNNDIVRDVSAAPDRQLFPDGEYTSWIRPGQSIWTWMSKKRDVTPENIRRFTDFAATLKIPYNLVDDGWVTWSAAGKDHWQLLKEQIDYAKNKGVGIWVWQAYPPHNGTPGLKDTAYMHAFFEKCASLGVKGMKIDFINAETQEKIAFYERVARAAARYHLMVDFHGANKGTGMEYTFPNVLSQEGVRGLEQKDNEHWPYLNTVLPFTRYLCGPADYTPVSFEPYASSTTMAHQVATAAIFTSPFLCLGADPGDLSKSIALPFVEQIPATWDETIVLKESKIGEIAAFARRKGTTWYLAVINGDGPHTADIDLSFLGGKKYTLTALTDKPNAREGQVTVQKKVKKNTTLHVNMPSGGGYLGIFKR